MGKLEQLTLVLNERCNQRCGYCYVPVHRDREMPAEVARRALELAFAHAAGAGPLKVGFFGGEPFLSAPLMRAVAERARALARPAQRVSFSSPTNGTCLGDGEASLARDLGLDVGLSLDGEGSARKLAGGQPSEALARRALPVLQSLPGVRLTVRMTVTPSNAGRLAANVRALFAAGARRIVFAPDLGSAWTLAAVDAWGAQLEALADWLLELRRAGRPAPELPEWKRISERLAGAPRRHCGAGVSRLTVDVDGALWPCHRIAFDRRRAAHALGDVRTGTIRADVQARFARLDPANPQPEVGDCRTCPAAPGCTLFCPALALQLTGDVERVPAAACALMRPQVAACSRLSGERTVPPARRTARHRAVLAASALAAVATLGPGCFVPTVEGEPDASVADGGRTDGGAGDAGRDDAGLQADAGHDAGLPDDAGAPDGGPDDGGYIPGIC